MCVHLTIKLISANVKTMQVSSQVSELSEALRVMFKNMNDRKMREEYILLAQEKKNIIKRLEENMSRMDLLEKKMAQENIVP